MPIKNYTTSVSEDKTVGEIMGLLAAKGARSVNVTYDDKGRASAVSFVILLKRTGEDQFGVPIPFKLPCNFEGVMRTMKKERSRNVYQWERNPENIAQARRVAWRIIKDWVEAQMALIEAEQASLAQVFLPYVVQRENGSGVESTLFDRFIEQTLNTKALPEAVNS